jgi:hypothetical protein
MLSERRPELSVNYIISQLEKLQFDDNNTANINELAESLELDQSCVHLIYLIISTEDLISFKEVDIITLNLRNSRLTILYRNYKNKMSTTNQVNLDNKKNFQIEIYLILSEVKIKIESKLATLQGFSRFLQKRFHSTTQMEQRCIIDKVLLREYRNEIEKWLELKKSKNIKQPSIKLRIKILEDLLSSESEG